MRYFEGLSVFLKSPSNCLGESFMEIRLLKSVAIVSRVSRGSFSSGKKRAPVDPQGFLAKHATLLSLFGSV